MKLQVLSLLLLLFFPIRELPAHTVSNTQRFSPLNRTFRFTYNFTVKDIPSGATPPALVCATGDIFSRPSQNQWKGAIHVERFTDPGVHPCLEHHTR